MCFTLFELFPSKSNPKKMPNGLRKCGSKTVNRSGHVSFWSFYFSGLEDVCPYRARHSATFWRHFATHV